MTLEEAHAKVAAAVVEVRAEGFRVWGWDEGHVIVAQDKPYRELTIDPAPR